MAYGARTLTVLLKDSHISDGSLRTCMFLVLGPEPEEWNWYGLCSLVLELANFDQGNAWFI